MINYPFHKLLFYLLVIAKFRRVEYASLLNTYLPSIKFDFEDPFEYIQKIVKEIPLPAGVYSNKEDPSSLIIYLSRFKLRELHTVFNQEQFEDIIFDTDLRRKIDAMALSPSFRKIDIIREFPSINHEYIEIYLDCFANFDQIDSRNIYVSKYIGDPSERSLLIKVLTTTSRIHLKTILGIRTNLDPKTIIEKSLSVMDMKSDLALINEDDDKLERWTKLRISIAEKLIKMGAGSKTDLDNLMEALKAEPDFKDPVIYTKEDLENEFSQAKDELPS